MHSVCCVEALRCFYPSLMCSIGEGCSSWFVNQVVSWFFVGKLYTRIHEFDIS